MTTFDFPQDLRAAQLALHRTRAELDRYVRTLPRPVGPVAVRRNGEHPHTDGRALHGDAPVPGRTREQRRRVAEYRARLRDLGAVVATHPFWRQFERGGSVGGRTRLRPAPERAAGTVPERAAGNEAA
ncbi:hypothetical protein ACIP6P_15615 [Streptomyces sp. NPDC088729]|uniref:hypothetical protein n=1 Tax=Streptomyces sp. NPDC088729 TaxID=3365876 RepID=UPI00381B02B4